MRHNVYVLESNYYFYFWSFRNFLMKFKCVEMELLRTFLIVLVIAFRVGECTLEEKKPFSGGYSLTCTSPECKQTVFSYGQMTFYQYFVSSYQSVSKTQRLSVVHSKRHNLFKVFLLLCGDVHPCPGPMGSSFANKSDYKCFEKKRVYTLFT